MVKAVLMDLSGTIHVGKNPLPGAIAAVQRLENAGIPVRFVTNTSRKTRDSLHDTLCEIGFDITKEQMFTAPLAIRRYLEQHGLRPYLLVHPNLVPEFDGIDRDNPDAVVVGIAEDYFNYRKMNEAFSLLKAGARLVATSRSRYFEGAGGLQLDAGPYVAALEYAAGTTAVILGKPSAGFFLQAAEDLGVDPSECVMVGDDAETDVAAALAAGVQGILVQTGKYRAGDESKIAGDFFLAGDVTAAVEEIISRIKRNV